MLFIEVIHVELCRHDTDSVIYGQPLQLQRHIIDTGDT